MVFRTKIFRLLLLIALLPLFVSFVPQEARVNQKKIEKQREKNQKEAQKQYEKALKRHHDNQSKATQKSMKRTKKESMGVTPIKR